MTVTEPLRAEHRELLPRIELLRDAAEALDVDDRTALERIEAAVAFLREHVIPHATTTAPAAIPSRKPGTMTGANPRKPGVEPERWEGARAPTARWAAARPSRGC